MTDSFDDIRPYVQEEIAPAMRRIASSEVFPLIASFVFPGENVEDVRSLVASLTTIEDFQARVMSPFNDQVVKRSITRFTTDGLNRIHRETPYLFVSNHRDIVLDSSLLQNVLFKNGFPTTEITFGANLMCTQLIVDIGKSNKMFRVERGGTPKEFYRCSLHLSEYIRHVLCEKKQSVWIAQRNGRTKDGNDKTDQGIIKMFAMSHRGDKISALSQLRIVPVSVSYEWEPCDMLKAFELYISRSQKYIKRPGEDVNSILTGIVQPKGRVHFEICPPIGIEELMVFSDCTQNEYHQQVALLLDKRIHEHYKLWPNNYIAHDLLYGQNAYSSLYTAEEKKAFIERMKKLNEMASLEKYDVAEPDVLNEIFLGIYAHPVRNRG